MPLQAPPFSPAVLLAIESPDRLDAVRAHLSELAVQCHCASSVSELAALLDEHGPVLAVLDLDFAGGCMLEFCLSHGTLLNEIPVIFCVSGGSEHFDRAMHAVRHGAKDFLLGAYDQEKRARLAGHLSLILAESTPEPFERSSGGPQAAQARDQEDPEQEIEESPVSEELIADLAPQRAGIGAVSVSDSTEIQTDLERHLRGKSPAMVAIRQVIERVAKMKATVLIHGESGTGKEVAATAIHRLSNRADQPFVPVNMTTIPHGLAESTLFGHEKGAFTSAHGTQIGWCEAAHGGTLFLDEIGEMELSIQPKLLRFLQESTIQRVGAHASKKVDVRVIAATNRDLKELVAERKMREDLYFRLHVVPIHLPPLRERREDIELLATLFLERSCEAYQRNVEGFTDEALEVLLHYSWPGNVRQLENIVERTVIFARGSHIDVREIPPEVHFEACFNDQSQSHAPSNGHAHAQAVNGDGVVEPAMVSSAASRNGAAQLSPMQRHERNAIVEALHRVDGHVTDAANLLGVGQATIYRKIKQYHIPHQRKRRRTPK